MFNFDNNMKFSESFFFLNKIQLLDSMSASFLVVIQIEWDQNYVYFSSVEYFYFVHLAGCFGPSHDNEWLGVISMKIIDQCAVHLSPFEHEVQWSCDKNIDAQL